MNHRPAASTDLDPASRLSFHGGRIESTCGDLVVADAGNHTLCSVHLADGGVSTLLGRAGQPTF